MDTRVRASIVTMRVAAVVVMIASVAALWNFMRWLPWPVDCAIAMAAALAFAYKFEREESRG